MDTDTLSSCRVAADIISQADGLLIGAGAGMGIDSGLPDFRGANGFWRAYPALGEAQIRFEEIACPDAFRHQPELAWGFYGHRLSLYRRTTPHAGFDILRNIGSRMPKGSFVFTSNVDGQFQKAGFAEAHLQECHGSIHWLQCVRPCSDRLWPAEFEPVIDEARCRIMSPLPRCPDCGGSARPNILMFHDWHWHEQRVRDQARRFTQWRSAVKRLAVVELGAGTHIPSVRHFCEEQGMHGVLIRINPTESHKPSRIRGASIAAGALASLAAINDALYEVGFWDGA